ncbi:MAG: putative aminopeptidase YsdC [Chloroflexi bacterium]|nr:putative aminopeptidase YsdC [Chloroflexota bacterium]
MKSLIKKFAQIPGPSGYENQIRAAVRAEVEPCANEVIVDALGNLIVRWGEKGPDGLRMMLSAHLDEIGVIATHVDKKGFVRFAGLGGVHPAYCVGGHVRFLNGTRGVISFEKESGLKKMPSLDKLFIDVGATSPGDCPVGVGDVAVFARKYQELGEKIVTKALDDRIGVVVLVEALRQLHEENLDSPHELYFVFSTQEEVGLRGAGTSAYHINPDLGLSVDVTSTGDTPKGSKMEVRLGEGPAIKVRDGGMLSDPRVVDWMVSTAEEHEIPCQLEILKGGTTDARAIQVTRAGVPVGCLSVPCRYVHSPSEMVDYGDVEDSVRLLVALLSDQVPQLEGEE